MAVEEKAVAASYTVFVPSCLGGVQDDRSSGRPAEQAQTGKQESRLLLCVVLRLVLEGHAIPAQGLLDNRTSSLLFTAVDNNHSQFCL